MSKLLVSVAFLAAAQVSAQEYGLNLRASQVAEKGLVVILEQVKPIPKSYGYRWFQGTSDTIDENGPKCGVEFWDGARDAPAPRQIVIKEVTPRPAHTSPPGSKPGDMKPMKIGEPVPKDYKGNLSYGGLGFRTGGKSLPPMFPKERYFEGIGCIPGRDDPNKDFTLKEVEDLFGGYFKIRIMDQATATAISTRKQKSIKTTPIRGASTDLDYPRGAVGR